MRITGELFLLDASSWGRGGHKKHSAGRSLPTPALVYKTGCLKMPLSYKIELVDNLWKVL